MAWRYWSAILMLTAALGGLAASVWHVGDAIARREPTTPNAGPAPSRIIGTGPSPFAVDGRGPNPGGPPNASAEPGSEDESGPAPGPFDGIAVPKNQPMDAFPDPETIVPLPPAAFPDDPPPHEGAMIAVPHVVEAPDLIRIELLEALPGRPIVGERLVRPDGMISLDYYGDLQVSGLTIKQIKTKFIIHMRRFIPDATLGLVEIDAESGAAKTFPPEDSDRVFVDVSSYNSKFYYVRGEVQTPGRLPVTGNETIQDALINAGGLARGADRRNIRLHRPPRGGRPAKTFPIDLDAIERGDPTANLQLFPGDRLVIGGDERYAARDDAE